VVGCGAVRCGASGMAGRARRVRGQGSVGLGSGGERLS
jgi:hypothetical protein